MYPKVDNCEHFVKNYCYMTLRIYFVIISFPCIHTHIYLFTAWANFKNLKRRHTIFDKTEKVIKDLDEKDLKAHSLRIEFFNLGKRICWGLLICVMKIISPPKSTLNGAILFIRLQFITQMLSTKTR